MYFLQNEVSAYSALRKINFNILKDAQLAPVDIWFGLGYFFCLTGITNFQTFNLLRLLNGQFAEPAVISPAGQHHGEGSALANGKEECQGGHNPTHFQRRDLDYHKICTGQLGSHFLQTRLHHFGILQLMCGLENEYFCLIQT